jgi:hypothetical protein
MISFDGPSTDPTEHFEQFEQVFEEEKKRALSEAKELARERVPVDEGDLRADISIDLERDVIFNTLEYAIYQNYGTEDVPATYYLTDSALDAWRNSIDRLQA